MHALRSLWCIGWIIGMLPLAHAQQTLWGTGGLVLNPTAELAPAPWSGQASYAPIHGGGRTTNWYSLSSAYRWREDVEIYGGLDIMRSGKSAEGITFVLNKRWVLSAEQDVAAAAGIQHAGIFKATSAYVVVSGSGTSNGPFPRSPYRGHLGVRWDRYSGNGTETRLTLFAGVEAELTPDWHLFAEVSGKHDRRVHVQTPFSFGLRYRTETGTGITIGAVAPGYAFADKTVLLLQVSRPLSLP